MGKLENVILRISSVFDGMYECKDEIKTYGKYLVDHEF